MFRYTHPLWKAFEGRSCLRQFTRADINVRRPTEACILNSDWQLDYIDVVVKVVELKSRANLGLERAIPNCSGGSLDPSMACAVSVAIGGPNNEKPSSVHVGGLLSQNAQM
jgi:hypothetical protein